MEQDPDNEDRQYVYASCAIPREYTAAADIIERKNGTKVSVELVINEMQYDSKSKDLLFTDVEVSGLTCLGTDPETGETAMSKIDENNLQQVANSVLINLRRIGNCRHGD